MTNETGSSGPRIDRLETLRKTATSCPSLSNAKRQLAESFDPIRHCYRPAKLDAWQALESRTVMTHLCVVCHYYI